MSLSMSAISVNAADPAATVPAKDAVIDGFSLKDTADEKPIEFLEDKNVIVGVCETSSAVYTVPEDFKGGKYDVYLQISKIASPFIGSSTPVTVSVNGGDVYVPTMREECFAPSEDAPEKSFVDEMGKMIGKDKHFDLFIIHINRFLLWNNIAIRLYSNILIRYWKDFSLILRPAVLKLLQEENGSHYSYGRCCT